MRARVNGRIKAVQVRVVSDDGTDLGVLSLADTLKLAASRGEDLVEIEPQAVPPVCQTIDYGKYRYRLSKAEKKKHGL